MSELRSLLAELTDLVEDLVEKEKTHAVNVESIIDRFTKTENLVKAIDDTYRLSQPEIEEIKSTHKSMVEALRLLNEGFNVANKKQDTILGQSMEAFNKLGDILARHVSIEKDVEILKRDTNRLGETTQVLQKATDQQKLRGAHIASSLKKESERTQNVEARLDLAEQNLDSLSAENAGIRAIWWAFFKLVVLIGSLSAIAMLVLNSLQRLGLYK